MLFIPFAGGFHALSVFLFSSYVERQKYDWIYKCPQEHSAEMCIVVGWKCYILPHLAPCEVRQPGQISFQKLISCMIMFHISGRLTELFSGVAGVELKSSRARAR